MQKLVLVLFLLFFNFNIQAEEGRYMKLDNFLDYVAQKNKAKGEVSIIQKGQSVYSKKYGSEEQPKDSIFRIGSISKVYTAVMIMKLVESGQLSLKDKLNLFYPQIPNSSSITIQHLLQHRSGLVNFTDLTSYFEFHEKPQSEEKLLKLFVKNGVVFSPGERYQYSNTGYVMLSFILQKVHQLSFQDILYNEIAVPLNLKDTYVYDSATPLAREVISYVKGSKWLDTTDTHQTVPLGAGAIAATSKEVGLFLWSLFNGQILKLDTVKQMKTLVEGYGLGLFSVPFYDKKGFGHNGGIDGYRSIGYHFADSDTVVVHLSNAMSMNMNDTSIAILSSVYDIEFETPMFEDEIILPVDILVLYEGLYKSDEIPLSINVTMKRESLFIQATGQPEIPLVAIKSNTFVHLEVGVKIVFNSELDKMDLHQAGRTFNFERGKLH